MKKIEKYTGEKTYMAPSGALLTKEAVLNSNPSALAFVHIVETDENGEVMLALQNLSVMRSNYDIDASLTEDEAIAAIQEIVNTPEEVSTDPTAEERIAAALEAQTMMAMDDVTA